MLRIKVHLTYCLGLLGDTTETVKDTIKKSLMLPADSRQYSIATPFVGSKLWEEYKEQGLIISDDYNCFDANHLAVVEQEHLPAKELINLKDMADRLNKGQIQNTVPATFQTKEFIDELTRVVSKYKSVLIMCTHRTVIIKEFVRLLYKSVGNINVIAEKPFFRRLRQRDLAICRFTKLLMVYAWMRKRN